MNFAIAEIGQFALLMCLPLAAVQTLLPLLGVSRESKLLINIAKPVASLICFFLSFSFITLAYTFIADDFSLRLAASHSNTALPFYYKISAVWGNHEGSLLMWALVLAVWTCLLSWRADRLPEDIRAYTLSTLGFVLLGFIAFIIFTSNPFERNLINPPLEGGDLNPLLQDIGLILHPPILYMGYVGFAVPFAFAIAALLSGRLDAAWVRWVRPWTNFSWAFLTVGIALGSWWAYYELGWGGWWFWDPVENASFMPWLAGTALILSLSATEKRGIFNNWTVLLAILTFSLSLVGTFLVRSGILVSVHAFASDPARGLFILAFLAVVTGGSLALYAIKAPSIKPTSSFSFISRETLLLLNNLLLSVALAIVLLGTLFPLLATSLDWGSYSVGPPYFNRLFVPLMIPLLLLVALVPFFNWKSNSVHSKQRSLWSILILLSMIVAGVWVAYLSQQYEREFPLIGFVFTASCCWLLLMTLSHPLRNGVKNGALISRLKKYTASYWGMLIAHSGLAITALGITFTVLFSQQLDVRMSIGDNVNVAGYRFELKSIQPKQGPNYSASRGEMLVYAESADSTNEQNTIEQLYPEKRLYHAGRNVMTEAGIAGGFTRDLYVSLGEQLDAQSWSVRVYVKAYVRFIWLGGLLMALGGVLAAMDKRYRIRSDANFASTNS